MKTSRRSLFALPLFGLAVPFSRGAASDHHTVQTGPVPTPLDEGLDGPPPPVRVLDPGDPVAVELGRLYDVLRSTHRAEIVANRAILDHDSPDGGLPEMDGDAWEAHCDESARLDQLIRQAERPRRAAYFGLMRAVIAAHGGFVPWLDEWYRYGTAHRVVRVADRVYSVCSDHDTEWPDNDDNEGDDPYDHGSTVLSVIDLDEIGGAR